MLFNIPTLHLHPCNVLYTDRHLVFLRTHPFYKVTNRASDGIQTGVFGVFKDKGFHSGRRIVPCEGSTAGWLRFINRFIPKRKLFHKKYNS